MAALVSDEPIAGPAAASVDGAAPAADNAREIQHTEAKLAGMIEELDANEFDLKGLCELKTLLEGN